MAQTDYVVRLTGKDDLSSTINSVKKELTEVGKATTNIDKIDAKFDRITKSSAPLKRQLRDLQALMAQMNMDGLSNTDQFTKIAQEAGKIKDAIADASTATQKFSSDTFKLDAAIQGIQGIAAATSIATGAMALYGNENKEVKEAILKVQAALSILNGVQAISNTLNKDSALMQRIKQIRMAASVQTTVADTVATNINSTATAANTVATVANTTATKAWNVAKAIGKALLGDWTGLLLVGVGALTTYAMATSNASEAEEEHQNNIRKSKEAQDTYTKTFKESFEQLTGDYARLKVQWELLRTTQEKNQFISDNKTKFEELGVSINNVTDAENYFNNATSNIVKSLEARAKAAAAYQKMMELAKRNVELQADYDAVTGNGGYFESDAIEVLDEISRNRQEMNKLAKDAISAVPKSNIKKGNTVRTTNKTNTKKEPVITPVNLGVQELVYDVSLRISPKEQKKIEDEFAKITEKLKGINRTQSVSTFDSVIGGDGDLLSNIENQMNFNDNLLNQLSLIKEEYAKLGKEGTQAYKDVCNEIMNVATEQNELSANAVNISNQKKQLEKNSMAWGYYSDMLYSASNAMNALGDSSEAQMAQFTLNSASIIANAVSTIAAMNAEALAKGASSAFALPFPANLAAWATVFGTITSIFASLPKFADGGIVGGYSNHGDKMLARLNGGEMVLNKRQQSNLFDALDKGFATGGNSTISFKIQGSDLYGTLKNYSKSAAKTGRITGIK